MAGQLERPYLHMPNWPAWLDWWALTMFGQRPDIDAPWLTRDTPEG